MTYIFVGGSQRTGTSIAQQMLCQLPEANPYLYEASFLRQLVSCYADARNDFNQNHVSYFENLQNLRDFNAGVVYAFLENVRHRLGSVQHLILKEPHLTMYWPFLFELVPEAKFLMMVRDPRDAVASMVQVGERQKKLGQEYLFVQRDVAELCRHFLSFYEPAFAVTDQRFRDHLGVVHYEELVADPKQTLRDVTAFTGVSFDQIDIAANLDTGHVAVADTSSSAMYSPWVTEVSGQKPSKGRIGNHANVLTTTEIAIVEHECADFFEWFGYRNKAA